MTERKTSMRIVEYDGHPYLCVPDLIEFLLDDNFTDEEKIQGLQKVMALGTVADLDLGDDVQLQ